jgi:hypothetical protein
MPWTVTVAQERVRAASTYERVVEILIGHNIRPGEDGVLLHLETMDGEVETRIRVGDTVTLTWEP